MIAYHFGFDLVDREYIPEGALYNPVLDILQPFFAGVFIALAGVSSRFSRSNLKRGLVLLGCAALVTAVSMSVLPDPWLSVRTAFGYEPTGMEVGELIQSGRITLHPDVAAAIDAYEASFGTPGTELIGTLTLSCYKNPLSLLGTPILFGILHLLAVCILLYAFMEKTSITVYAVTLGTFFILMNGVTEWPHLPSADYFPLIPWVFVFFFGVALGEPVKERKFPQWFYNAKIPVLPAVGRRSLLIYLLHQPLLYGILWAYEALIGG